jgi:hypothetical protein
MLMALQELGIRRIDRALSSVRPHRISRRDHTRIHTFVAAIHLLPTSVLSLHPTAAPAAKEGANSERERDVIHELNRLAESELSLHCTSFRCTDEPRKIPETSAIASVTEARYAGFTGSCAKSLAAASLDVTGIVRAAPPRAVDECCSA